jgi:hypothetical protein
LLLESVAHSAVVADTSSPANVMLNCARELAVHGHQADAAATTRYALQWLQKNAHRLPLRIQLEQATALHMLGDVNGASQYMQSFMNKSMSLHDSALVRVRLAYYLALQGLHDAAIAQEVHVLERGYDDPSVTLERARLARALGNQREAANLIEEAYGEGLPESAEQKVLLHSDRTLR